MLTVHEICCLKLILILHVKATTFEPQKLCVFTCFMWVCCIFKSHSPGAGGGGGWGLQLSILFKKEDINFTSDPTHPPTHPESIAKSGNSVYLRCVCVWGGGWGECGCELYLRSRGLTLPQKSPSPPTPPVFPHQKSIANLRTMHNVKGQEERGVWLRPALEKQDVNFAPATAPCPLHPSPSPPPAPTTPLSVATLHTD